MVVPLTGLMAAFLALPQGRCSSLRCLAIAINAMLLCMLHDFDIYSGVCLETAWP